MAQNTDAILRELRAYGLAYPGAHTKSPWPGHLDLAVKDKTFAYLSLEGEPLGISCKLPRSSAIALMLPFCTPTEYGLGKSGWVSAKFDGDNVPVDMLKDWIDESYRAQAPKKLIAAIATAPAAVMAAPAAKSKARAKPKAKPVAKAKKPAAKAKKPAATAKKPAAKAKAKNKRR